MGIDEKINILNNKKPFPKYTQNSLEEDFKLRFIYHSINIEGSTLNLLETKVILEGIAVNNHSLEEHLMVTRLERVYEYIINTQKNGEPFNSKELCTLTEITDIGYIEEVYSILDKVNFGDKLSWKGILDLCIKIHDRLIEINGYLARLIVNYILIEFGYLPVIIKDYEGSLEGVIENSENEMIDLYLELV